jgi:hypothetical protein
MNAGTLFLVALFILRMYVLLASPAGLSGDAIGYAAKAHLIAHSGRLPPLSLQPFGFPVLLAPLTIAAGDALPRAVLWIHCLMDALVVFTLVSATYRIFQSPSHKWIRTALSALILLQPFTASMASTVNADHSSGFFVFFAIYCLDKAAALQSRAGWFACAGGLLLGLAGIERVDLLPVGAGLVAFFGAYVPARDPHRQNRRAIFALLLTAFLSAPLGMAAFQYYSTGEVGLLQVTNRHKPIGFLMYARTWFSTQSEYIRFAYDIGAEDWEGFDLSAYPSRAFQSNEEKAKAAELLRQWKRSGYTAEVNAAFNDLAQDKIDANPVKQYVGIPLLRMAHYWLNLDGAQTLLRIMNLKSPFSTAIVFVVLCIRLLIILLTLIGLVALYARFARKGTAKTRMDTLVLFAAIAVAIRTLTLGALSPFLEAGLMEYRYAGVMFPAMIWIAIFGAYHCVSHLRHEWRLFPALDKR